MYSRHKIIDPLLSLRDLWTTLKKVLFVGQNDNIVQIGEDYKIVFLLFLCLGTKHLPGTQFDVRERLIRGLSSDREVVERSWQTDISQQFHQRR